jgi:chain length determinant protein tyrosine kinase EpsG
MAQQHTVHSLPRHRAGADGGPDVEPPEPTLSERPIGEILREIRQLSDEQVAAILTRQRLSGQRFGEAAVSLRLARNEDVLWALSQQFHYPYSPEGKRSVSPELVVANEPFSQRAESFRAMRSQLIMRLFSEPDSPRRAIAVVSPASGDGKTYFAANMAVAFSQLGGRTLLVDADMRNPRQHEVFGIDGGRGLSALLSGRDAGQVIHNVPNLPSLFVLPVGTTPPNPLELVERPAFGLLMAEMLAKFDHVVVDTSAAMLGADASVVAARCGAAIMVVRKDEARATMLQDFVSLLGAGSVKLGGVVMNEY